MTSYDFARNATAASLIWRLGASYDPEPLPSTGEELTAGLLHRLHALSPTAFERLAIEFLLALGYGPHAIHTGRRGDGGVDGVLSTDHLGLHAVYFQAKRYSTETVVPVSDVRDFAGSLDAHRAAAGVFLTTGRISHAADAFVERHSRRLVLICGQTLAELLIKLRIGVKSRRVYEVREIDEDYFESMMADPMISASIQPRR